MPVYVLPRKSGLGSSWELVQVDWWEDRLMVRVGWWIKISGVLKGWDSGTGYRFGVRVRVEQWTRGILGNRERVWGV